MSAPTREDFMAAMIESARAGLRSGVPREQLFWYLHATYRSAVDVGDIRSAADLVSAEP